MKQNLYKISYKPFPLYVFPIINKVVGLLKQASEGACFLITGDETGQVTHSLRSQHDFAPQTETSNNNLLVPPYTF